MITRHVDKGGNHNYSDDYDNALRNYMVATDAMGYWPTLKDCDATLWAGLASWAGADLDIKEAFASDGSWHRRPLKESGPCFLNGFDLGSKTSISNDMIIGVLFALNDDRQAMQQLWTYAKNNLLIMGEPVHRVGEVILKPNVISLLRGILGYKINLPPIYTSGGADYVKHLTAISIHLHGVIHGHIKGHHLQVLKSLVLEESDNATFEAILQRYTKRNYLRAVKLLRNGKIPSYVRGSENYHLVYQLFTWRIICHG